MAAIGTCPDPTTLERFLLGLLYGPEAEQVGEHLMQCEACLSRIESACGQDTFAESLRGQEVATDRSDELVVRELIERVRRLRASPTRKTESGDTPSSAPAPTVDPLSVLAPAQAPDELGRLGGYRVLKLLGQGGMGVVFHAEDPVLGRPVALKVMLPALALRADSRKRFLREARAAAQVRSDHVVVIHQVGEEGGVPFLAMELLPGQSLDDWLKGDHKSATAEVLRLGQEMARGLAAAHARGLVHRDVKPANVWLEAPTGRVKLLDFGLARPQESADGPTREGELLGTPAYMAPEQVRGESIDGRADLFSLGVVLYRLCTGQLPFRGTTAMSQLATVLTDEARPVRELNPEVPPALADLVMKLLAKKACDRPASAAAVVETLAALAAKRPASAGDTALIPPPSQPLSPEGRGEDEVGKRRPPAWRRVAIAFGALAAVSLLGVIIIRIRDNKTGKETVITIHDQNPDPGERKDDRPPVKLPDPPDAPSPLDKLDPAQIPTAERFPWQPRELVAVIGEHRHRHWKNCTAVALSPDGKYAASGSIDGRIFLYDAKTGQQVETLAHGYSDGWLAFSPDGKTLAACGPPGPSWTPKVSLWDLGGKPYLKATIVDEKADRPTRIAFSPDGRTLAMWNIYESPAPLMLWDVTTNTPKLRARYPKCRHASFSEDGKSLAVTDENGMAVQLYDPAASELKPRLVLPLAQEALTAEFAPDGRLHVFAQDAWSIWDVTGEKPRSLTTVEGRSWAVFSPDGSRAYTARDQEAVEVWDLRDLPPTKRNSFNVWSHQKHWHGGQMRCLAVGVNDTLVAGHLNGDVTFWRASTGLQKTPPAPQAWAQYLGLPPILSPDGRTLACRSADNRVRVWNLANASPRELAVLEPTDWQAFPLSFEPGEQVLWMIYGSRFVRLSRSGAQSTHVVRAGDRELRMEPRAVDGTRALLTAPGGPLLLCELQGNAPKTLHVAEEHKGHVEHLGLAGDTAASAEQNGKEVVIWRIATDGKMAEWARLPRDGVRGLALSPEGSTLAVRDPQQVCLYSLTDKAPVERLVIPNAGLPDYSPFMVFAPDGKTLAIAAPLHHGWSTSVLLVDTATGHRHRRWEFPGHVHGVRYAPDGRHLFTFNGNGTIYVLRLTENPAALVRRPAPLQGLARWDVQLEAHDGQPPPKPVSVTLGASPDGKTLATGTADGKVALWDIAAAKAPQPLKFHRGAVRAPVWSPDGKRLATVSTADHTLAMWSSTGELLWTLGDFDYSFPGYDGLQFSADGRLLLVVHDTKQVARLVDAATGRVLQELEAKWGGGTWSPDSRRIFTISPTDDWRNSPVTAWEQSPDGGKWVAKAKLDPWPGMPHEWSRDRQRGTAYHGKTLVVIDPDGAKLAILQGDTNYKARPRWSPGDSRLAVDDTVYDTATWKPLSKIPFEPNSLGWSAGGQLVAGSDRGRVQAFDSATGDPVGGVLQTFEGDAWLLVGADGHYRCSPGLEKHLVYITRTPDGKEERLSPEEFAKKYGWKNYPARAKLLP